MADSKKGKSRRSQQVIKAVKGSTIREVIQAVVNGDGTGDVHIVDKIYNRSELEDLNDYLTKAMFAFESRLYQTLRRPASAGRQGFLNSVEQSRPVFLLSVPDLRPTQILSYSPG